MFALNLCRKEWKPLTAYLTEELLPRSQRSNSGLRLATCVFSTAGRSAR